MRPPVRRLHGASRDHRHERGAALVLGLVVLVGLSGLAIALLAIGGIEPQISRNHVDMLRARYLAEAGIEHGFDTLASSIGSWDVYLNGATCRLGAVLAQSTLPGLSRAHGEFTVRVRNDCEPGDERLTGVTLEAATDATRDTNGKLMIASTGVIATTTQTITAVVSDGRSSVRERQSVSRAQVTTHTWADH
jgi:Tfp pilus assembly protein PilX